MKTPKIVKLNRVRVSKILKSRKHRKVTITKNTFLYISRQYGEIRWDYCKMLEKGYFTIRKRRRQ